MIDDSTTAVGHRGALRVATDAVIERRAHPDHLLRADERYLVAWGDREILINLTLALALSSLTVVLALTASIWWFLALVPIASAAALGVLFFRNPKRRVPDAPALFVAPADGTIWDIESLATAADGIPAEIDEPCVRIGIFLSIFSVHVNRAPTSGCIRAVRYRPGFFHDARDRRAAQENESNTIVLECTEPPFPPGVCIAIRQISGAVARRIICPLGTGVGVARGGLLGMIKYGSRTEILIPERLRPDVRVRVGDKVSGGETVLATFDVDSAGVIPQR